LWPLGVLAPLNPDFRFSRGTFTHPISCSLSVLAYNLCNLWRRLVLPARNTWSLTSLQQRLVKTGGRLVKHARYYWLLLAESHLTRRLFGAMLQRIWALPAPTG
jgi:Transposase DDE domain group 1